MIKRNLPQPEFGKVCFAMRCRALTTSCIIVFFLFSPFSAIKAFSQPLPPFKMTLTNNTVFDITETPKGKPIVLIYFDPDCDHCQRLMDTLFRKINEFNKAEIVIASFKPLDELPAFEKKYNTAKYQNVRVGTENRIFYLRMYFDVATLPFTALYDKKRNLNHLYREGTPVNDLVKRLKSMK